MNTSNPTMHAAPAGAGDGVVGIDIRHLSPVDFARLGAGQVAYVRPVLIDGQQAWAIHAADGTPMAVAPTLELASAAIVQHEMQPVQVH